MHMFSALRTPIVIGKALLGGETLVSRLDRRVRSTDCDFNRHLTNSMYPRYMDLGRWDLMIRCGALKQCFSERFRPIVVELNIRYLKELKYGTPFTLDTRFTEIDGKALVIEQHFLVDGVVHAKGVVRSLVVGSQGVTTPDAFAGFLVDPMGAD